MFDASSRYAKIDNATYVDASGTIITYKRRPRHWR